MKIMGWAYWAEIVHSCPQWHHTYSTSNVFGVGLSQYAFAGVFATNLKGYGCKNGRLHTRKRLYLVSDYIKTNSLNFVNSIV